MGTRAKEAFNYGVHLDQFDEEKFIHTKNLHVWVYSWREILTQHTFKKACNSELMCRNLTNFK